MLLSMVEANAVCFSFQADAGWVVDSAAHESDWDQYKHVQRGAVKLVLWRHRRLVTQAHPVTSENQFHCTRLHLVVHISSY